MTICRAWCIALAMVVGLGVGCTDGTDRTDGGQVTIDEAYANVRELVEKTRREIGNDYEMTPEPDNGTALPCDDPSTEETYKAFGYRFVVESETDAEALIETVRSLWRQEGHQVQDQADGPWPALLVSRDGYDFIFEIRRDDGRARLGGSTPCFGPADA